MRNAALPRVSSLESRARCGGTCGRQNALLKALRVVKPASREVLAGKRASFSRLRRAGSPSCAKGRAPGLKTTSTASLRRRTARCPTPRRNVTQSAPAWIPRRGPSAHLMRPPQTRSSLTLPRGREAPDAPRSARNSPTRVHPARTALRMAAPRLSSPRHKICAGRRSLAARPRPTALPCNALHGAPASTALAASPRTRQFCATRKTPFCADQGSSLTSCRDFRPTGKEKCRDSLSLTKRWPEAESDEPCGKCPPPRATAVRRRRFRRASGHSFIGTRPRNARSVRREFHKPFRAPSRGSRARTARQNVLRRR